MGYEVMLAIPVIMIIGFTIAKYTRNIILKLVWIVVTILGVLFFAFVYPAPLGIDTYHNKIYWNGGVKKGGFGDRFELWKDKTLKKMGIEFVED